LLGKELKKCKVILAINYAIKHSAAMKAYGGEEVQLQYS
jgi:hypothetical protein